MNPIKTATYSVATVRKTAHMEERNKLEDTHLRVNRSTFHRACFLIPDYDGVYRKR